MEIIRSLDGFPKKFCNGALAIGKFDGMHRGHTLILAKLLAHAQKRRIPAIAFTFEPMPIQILRPELGVLPLSTLEQKIELIEKHGVDALVVCPTDHEFLNRTADEFFEHVICETFGTQIIIEGRNFFFGHNREGTPKKLQQLCVNADITLEIIETIAHNGENVSSSHIRRLLQEGKITIVNDLLSHPYRLSGTVTTGEQRGRTLGFPTANLCDVKTVIPQNGLYAAIAHHAGNSYAASVHIGTNPTFGETPFKIEAYLLDFNDDLYGETLHLDFLQRQRDVITYTDVDLLLRQMQIDVGETAHIVKQSKP